METKEKQEEALASEAGSASVPDATGYSLASPGMAEPKGGDRGDSYEEAHRGSARAWHPFI